MDLEMTDHIYILSNINIIEPSFWWPNDPYPSIYSSNFPPKPQPRAHQEMSSLTNDLPSVCFLGLGVLFFTHSCVWPSHENSWVQISVPHDLWGLQAGMAPQQKLHSPVPVLQTVPHLQRQRHGPLHAILHVRGWTLVAVGTATSLDGTATKKKRSASDGSPAGHRSSLTRTPEKCTCERRNTVQTNIPYYGWSWSPINYIGSISLSHSKSLY
jgi:hypothetical protein